MLSAHFFYSQSRPGKVSNEPLIDRVLVSKLYFVEHSLIDSSLDWRMNHDLAFLISFLRNSLRDRNAFTRESGSDPKDKEDVHVTDPR